MMKTCVPLAVLLSSAVALDVLPPRSRGGKLADLVPSWKEDVSSAKLYTYEAPLDHFKSTGKTIPVRYWVDETCFSSEADRAVFVHMGGEGAARGSSCSTSSKKHNAAVLSVEHRFYGESLPKVDEPLSKEYLEYLSVEQNLADTHAILDIWKKKLNATKAVAFGGSYSGATCSWFKQKYPDSINGCVSQSGVIDTVFDFTGFDTRTFLALSSPDPSCAKLLNESTLALERRFAAGKGAETKQYFNAGNLIGTRLGDSDFFYAIIDALAQLDQYGQKKVLCDGFAKLPANPTDDDRIKNTRDIIEDYYGKNFVNGCFYDSECLIKTVSASGSGGVGEKQWRWQKCTQCAFLQSAPATNSVRSTKYLTLPMLVEQCAYVFDFTAQEVHNMNAHFTAEYYHKTEKETTNVFYINYSDDPWRVCGVFFGGGFFFTTAHFRQRLVKAFASLV